MLVASPLVPMYRCPGETYDIPHAVHMARMAAGYPRCRECTHQEGRVPADTDGDASPASQNSRSLFGTEGVRGVYLNELTRQEAGKLAGAFASCLWDEFAKTASSAGAPAPSPLTSPSVERTAEGVVVLGRGRPGPLVVLAHDERPASPDLVMGAGVALRRMGCQVVDIGAVTRPAFWFAVDHLHAAGGIHVTGSGCDAAWTGMDFVGSDVAPWSQRGRLDVVESRYHEGYSRPSRRPGSQRLFSATAAYEAGLWKHIHALRPLKIALACPNRILGDLLTRLLRKSACRLLPVATPVRKRDIDDPREPDVLRVSTAVRTNQAHLGILIDDDAQRCVVYDNLGERVESRTLLALLGRQELETSPNGRIVWEESTYEVSSIPERDTRSTRSTLAEMSFALRAPGALCGGDASGRFWFVESYPVCDAVLTLIKLLHVLSRSDAPLCDLSVATPLSSQGHLRSDDRRTPQAS